jgi:hypothetical protein
VDVPDDRRDGGRSDLRRRRLLVLQFLGSLLLMPFVIWQLFGNEPAGVVSIAGAAGAVLTVGAAAAEIKTRKRANRQEDGPPRALERSATASLHSAPGKLAKLASCAESPRYPQPSKPASR